MRNMPPRSRWCLLIPALLMITLAGCAVGKPSVAGEGAPVTITAITPHEVGGKMEVSIAASGPIRQYTSFQITEPLRLVVDMTDADIGAFKEAIPVKNGAITDIVPMQKDNIARLEIGLTQAVGSKVFQANGKLFVEIDKPVTAETGSLSVSKAETKPTTTLPLASKTTMTAEMKSLATATPAGEVQRTQRGTARVISSVRAYAVKKGVRVVIKADGTMVPNVFLVEGNRLVVDIPDVTNRARPRVIPVRRGGVLRVRIGQHAAPDKKVRIVLDLAKAMEYTVTPRANTVRIALLPIVAEQKTTQPIRAAVTPKVSETAPVVEAAKAKAGISPPATTAPVKEEPAPSPPETTKLVRYRGKMSQAKILQRDQGAEQYTGKKISLDLQDADLVNVMRLFAEIANLNIILAPDVKGKVTVRMVNVPWDQAMAIILKMNGYGYALDGNILRIASLGALTREAEEETRSKEVKKKAEDLVTRIIPINYTTAAAIESTIKKSLSSRGETVTDARTNTLIVKDLPANVEEVVSLVKLLDKPIPQIMIEARIVEANLTFSRQIGVQWGGQYQANAAYGNPTGYTFPNSIGVTGGPTMGATPSGIGNYFVNMPAAAGAGTGGGALGFTFGSLGKSLNLDLVLSALESTGEGKIISTPRVSALDNTEAKISQGVSIPYSTTSAGGTQIQFIQANLSLDVTPHATPDNKIFLKIKASKNAPDPSLLGASGQPSISQNEADTQILLSDGETAVVGGILILNRGTSYTKVPFFGDLPLIGWLFRSKTTTEQKQELLIFITPRIVRQETVMTTHGARSIG